MKYIQDNVRRLDGSWWASEPLGEDEIVAAEKGQGMEEEERNSEDDMESSKHEKRRSHTEGVKYIEGILHYLQQG